MEFYKQKMHKLMRKFINLAPEDPLGGMKSDLPHLKSAFHLIIYIAGMDGVSPPEIMQIKNKIKSIALARFEEIDKDDIYELEEFCDHYITLINDGRITQETILVTIPQLAEEFLAHVNRLEIRGDRILVLLYLAIVIAYSDGLFSEEEQAATVKAAQFLNIDRHCLENLQRLAKINTALKGIKIVDDPHYNAEQDLEAFYQHIFAAA